MGRNMKSTRPKTVTITRNDLVRALREPQWSARTCLLAQTAKRNGILERNNGSDYGKPDPYALRDASSQAWAAMNMFDAYLDPYGRRDSKLLRRLKSMLPIKVHLSRKAT